MDARNLTPVRETAKPKGLGTFINVKKPLAAEERKTTLRESKTSKYGLYATGNFDSVIKS
jgi:hypothetical protein